MADKERMKKILLKAKNDKVFFAEHFLLDNDGQPYKLEEHQKLFLKDDSPYKILFCSRRSGKSLMMHVDILHSLFFLKNQNLVYLGPTLEQSKTFARVMDDIIYRSPLIKSSFEIDNKLDKMLTNRNRIKFATASAKSGQAEDSAQVGSGYTRMYLDEAQSLNEETLGTLIPSVLGQKGNIVHLFIAGTPRTKRDFFYKSIKNSFQISEVYNTPQIKKTHQDGLFSVHRFQLTDIENDKILYTRSPDRMPIEELEHMKSIIGTEKFRREFCLEFLDTTSLPFYDTLVQQQGFLKKPDTFQSNLLACGGVDFGKVRNNSVLCIGTYNHAIQKWEIKYYKAWPLGTRYQEITHYINNILPLKFPKLIKLAVDATGVGKAVTENLNYRNRFEIKDIMFSQPMKVSLVENAVMNLETDYVRFYNHPILDKEMAAYTRLINDNNRVLFEKGESDDFVDAFNMCNHVITDITNQGLLYKTHIPVTGLGANFLQQNTNHQAYNRQYNTNNLRQARENHKGVSPRRR